MEEETEQEKEGKKEKETDDFLVKDSKDTKSND